MVRTIVGWWRVLAAAIVLLFGYAVSQYVTAAPAAGLDSTVPLVAPAVTAVAGDLPAAP
ncbi:MAG TPA: hypothetical protein VER55_01215 [Ardenticatenaceae bacterium]|nr:hypothetical protein [Ardenticatenaceae bacterium]